MKRRDFLKTGAAAAGLVGSLTIEPTLPEPKAIPNRRRDKQRRHSLTIARLSIFTACRQIHSCLRRRCPQDRIRSQQCR